MKTLIVTKKIDDDTNTYLAVTQSGAIGVAFNPESSLDAALKAVARALSAEKANVTSVSVLTTSKFGAHHMNTTVIERMNGNRTGKCKYDEGIVELLTTLYEHDISIQDFSATYIGDEEVVLKAELA